ncbi:MAG: ribonuclease Y [Candidatus Taylorbacteria bacterium RIFCSPLOWO2_01_FULL_44_26]|uniref:Ribonuclease Y n=2 Tax=Candidatus Tayloriibacteriota TaxID=1817919 RepID=A0A1G2MLL1_9BACT|nr:MAG: ribonuclease Y [Candidatus Taylorbacteria bacterium RIFCSPHIGHO2_02_FULL_44_12]OHA31150.1 MAG: ribonuclease Y [Candidatus Taylorbacteria bacterium RIFCSPLOWO2_01_FULL_44_26]
MSLKLVALFLSIAGVAGVAVGYYLRLIISLGKKGSMEIEIKEMLLSAREEAKKITSDSEVKASKFLEDARKENKEKEEKIRQTEGRLIKKEDLLDKRQLDLEKEVELIKEKIGEIKTIRDRTDKLEQDRIRALEGSARLSLEDAKKELLMLAEKQAEADLLVRIKKLETQGEEILERKAKDILAMSIQRLASSVAQDVMSTSVEIPSDDIKGKIIGKEGRNIKAFERMTGVEVLIDDTPGTITISSFDPIRRHIARIALQDLIKDGRIQPAKIEQLVEKAKQEINKTIKEKGEAAAYECGILGLDPRILLILGRLHFRTSYGQNVLQHSIEMSHIAGMIAEELGANVQVAKAGALLHDLGKALDHEVTGSHVEIGRRILQKFGAPEEVIKAMQAHHEEHPYETIESRIVQTADAISGARPGARRDNIEHYLKRLGELEALANSFPGIEKSYALQAGREIRIFVKPEELGDLEAKNLARNIATKIEKDLKYPGEIKVTVIRETRTVDFAR